MADVRRSNQRTFHLLNPETHFQHATGSKFWRDRLKHHFGFDVWQLPVCEQCEGYALWHKNSQGLPVGVCPDDGHITANPLTVEQYYTEGHHIDRTLKPDAPVIVDRKRVNPRDTATVYGGEAGLADEHKKIVVARR